MRSYKTYLPVILLLGLVFALVLIGNYSGPDTRPVMSRGIDSSVEPIDRIKRLEPAAPQDMMDPPFFQLPLPSQVVPIQEVMEKGREISLECAYNDPGWQRPAYKSYWHSTDGWRWCYVPNRIHYALHRLFVTYPTASVYYDFVHDLGISEESDLFNFHVDKPFEKMVVVAMQSNIRRIVTLGNQVVLVAEPGRSGLQAVTVPLADIQPFNPEEALLVLLATPDGYELDYALITYVKVW